MFLSADNKADRKVAVYDCRGNEISGVVSFDTETKEVEMIVYLVKKDADRERNVLFRLGSNGAPEPCIVKVTVPGSYAIVDGQMV